jgi:hypothetical protein
MSTAEIAHLQSVWKLTDANIFMVPVLMSKPPAAYDRWLDYVRLV